MSDVTTAPDTETVDEGPIVLTESAAAKVLELMQREENAAEVALRVAVQPGGCSGMRYALFFDDRQLDGDKVATLSGVPVRIDKMSAPYLRGTQIDWVDSLQGAGFAINNPNAQSTCACGDSFH
ncbi:MAG: iron-sulfur cluster assembly accessory protein [Actinomycetota bacterium]|jgi:iron-sulfur cluster assembly accessory protein|nr:iron-sulfur cluster assembly accessory protein [Euzebyaceae bacterium]MDQ3029168.1 iron-sulfur cluster assembly accessory protein [Actinomycetota bacterium]MDQ3529186.1 iron-sulfur cluster assembly accessory protein [Actinomycetota bacterium]MDQ3538424.1 iron-sulfur cluster assembly accessory protein [Actinomycetota bacterium]MDQ3707878.1 iron-sulfur cluster assembly accessory protein [Actinomycetota bacterium]